MNLCRFCSTLTFFEEENEVLTVFTGKYKYICTEDVVIKLIHSGTQLEHFSLRFLVVGFVFDPTIWIFSNKHFTKFIIGENNEGKWHWDEPP